MTLSSFDFSHYFRHDELVAFLDQMAINYPYLIQRQVIGQSYGGKDIWLATLTQQNTGDFLEKPAYWIDANTHASEVTGSAVACYILYYLLTHYGQVEQVTYLLDHYTIYILPRIAVDGAEKYLTTPYYLRSSIRPYPHDDEKDGLHREDINNDGLILQMRIKDEAGAWKVSTDDPRLMIPREPDEFGGTYYNLFPEGTIRNYDGYEVKLAPSVEGLDFNRNYPYLWQPEAEQQGAGEFPFSEPETRAEAEFWRTHPNINGFITYHTYSAVILRPYSTHPDDHFPVEDLEIFKLIGEKGTKITGYPCISVYHDFRYHPKETTTGVMDDYAYDHWGWFGFTIELWDAPTEAGIQKEDYIRWFSWHPPEDDLKLLKWNDEHLGGKGFIAWTPFDHPQLGTVEIGGWDEKNVWRNAPAQYLPELCQKQCDFAISHALMSPRLTVVRHEVSHQGENIYHVTVQWQNIGFLPTYTSQKALERKAVQPIKILLQLPEDATLVSGQREQEIGHLEGRANKVYRSYAKGNDNRCHREWVIKAPTGGKMQITAIAQRAGTVRCWVEFKENQGTN